VLISLGIIWWQRKHRAKPPTDGPPMGGPPTGTAPPASPQI
jgi:hypothetical protein